MSLAGGMCISGTGLQPPTPPRAGASRLTVSAGFRGSLASDIQGTATGGATRGVPRTDGAKEAATPPSPYPPRRPAARSRLVDNDEMRQRVPTPSSEDLPSTLSMDDEVAELMAELDEERGEEEEQQQPISGDDSGGGGDNDDDNTSSLSEYNVADDDTEEEKEEEEEEEPPLKKQRNSGSSVNNSNSNSDNSAAATKPIMTIHPSGRPAKKILAYWMLDEDEHPDADIDDNDPDVEEKS
ncbi:nucleoplasmin-like protein ANO39 [Monomorium pharaonis]|uniref:nucleoplasmin-like protein ANO39 n=1 Tax=Monomorium pharaonis TaxID=307658 RepID=UPI0017465DFE|nr:nucleoplasmin-like protein ANO39 [Monomorium pharaonis]